MASSTSSLNTGSREGILIDVESQSIKLMSGCMRWLYRFWQYCVHLFKTAVFLVRNSPELSSMTGSALPWFCKLLQCIIRLSAVSSPHPSFLNVFTLLVDPTFLVYPHLLVYLDVGFIVFGGTFRAGVLVFKVLLLLQKSRIPLEIHDWCCFLWWPLLFRGLPHWSCWWGCLCPCLLYYILCPSSFNWESVAFFKCFFFFYHKKNNF